MKNDRIKLVKDIEILSICNSQLLTGKNRGNKLDRATSVTNHFLSSKFFSHRSNTLIATLIT